MNPIIQGLGNARYRELLTSAQHENKSIHAVRVPKAHLLSRLGTTFIHWGTQLKATGDASTAKRRKAEWSPFRRAL